MNPKLSAIIITRNEERDLPACLESLKGWVDEIVVVDNQSSDRTKEIAGSFGARVFDHEFQGYGPQKQFALEQAAGEWVLNVDADERVTPALVSEIDVMLRVSGEDNLHNGYSIPFQMFFMGKRLRFGGCFREFHVRLFKRSKARYGGTRIHEGITVEGSLGTLGHPIRHESYRNFAEYLEKCRTYTGLIAAKKFREGKRFSAWHNLRLPWEFFVRYFLKLGFLDGRAGFAYAALSSFYAWLKHVRLTDYERGVADDVR